MIRFPHLPHRARRQPARASGPGAGSVNASPGWLARTTIAVSSMAGAPPVSDFFSAFDDDDDQPALVGALPPLGRAPASGALYENTAFTFTTTRVRARARTPAPERAPAPARSCT